MILPLGRRNIQLGDGNSRTRSREDEKRRPHNRVVGDLLPMAVAEDEHGGLGELVAGASVGLLLLIRLWLRRAAHRRRRAAGRIVVGRRRILRWICVSRIRIESATNIAAIRGIVAVIHHVRDITAVEIRPGNIAESPGVMVMMEIGIAEAD